MEEEDYRRRGQQLEERVSESAEAMRNISAFQLMTQADLSQPQVAHLQAQTLDSSKLGLGQYSHTANAISHVM